MITIKRATKSDLPAISHLMCKYGSIMQVSKEHLNNRDIALQARTDEGVLVGFVFVGLMANNSVGYIDKLVVDPECTHKQVAQKLFHAGLELAMRRGVREIFGCIRQDEFHNRCAMGAIKACLGADSLPYTFVRADLNNIYLELKNAGVI